MRHKSRQIELKIKLTSPFLGNRMDQNSRTMRFDIKGRNSPEPRFMPDLEQWRWALGEALDILSDTDPAFNEIDVDFVSFTLSIKSPTVRTFTRRQNTRNPMKNQEFESFNAGTVMTIPIVLLGSMERDRLERATVRPPTEEELKKCFTIIGSNIGLSPWGSIYGYGRFDVL